MALIALAALYGALHDQVSYGLGPDYFTCLKFPQFGLLDTALAPPWRAARVGLQAGAVAGLPLGLALLWLARGRPAGDRYLWRGSAAVLLGALGCVLLGLGLGWLALARACCAGVTTSRWPKPTPSTSCRICWPSPWPVRPRRRSPMAP